MHLPWLLAKQTHTVMLRGSVDKGQALATDQYQFAMIPEANLTDIFSNLFKP